MSTAAPQAGAIPLWRRLVAYLGAALVGGMLLLAGAIKALDPAGFAEQISADAPFVASLAFPLAIAGVVLEVVLGAALILGFRSRPVIAAGVVMVLIFLAVTVPKIGDEDAASCGCFGNFVVRTPAETVVEDLLMLGGLGLALIGGTGVRLRPWRAGLLGVLAVGGLGLSVAAPSLPLDNFATRLKPGATAEGLQLLEPIPDLEYGRHVVMITDMDLWACGDVPESLYEFSEAQTDATLWLVKPSDVLARDGATWTCLPGTAVVEVPEAATRPLYRTLPRSFESVDGIVSRTWQGLPAE